MIFLQFVPLLAYTRLHAIPTNASRERNERVDRSMGGYRRVTLEPPWACRGPRKGRRSGAFYGRIVAWNRLIVAQRVPNDGHSVRARLATWHAKITLLLPGTEGNHCEPRMTRGPDEVIGPPKLENSALILPPCPSFRPRRSRRANSTNKTNVYARFA